MTTLTPDRLQALLITPDATHLIDVRSAAEFNEVHVDGAQPHPLHTLDPAAVTAQRPAAATGPVAVLCRGGQRAAQAVAKLNAAGVEAVVVQGGTLACVNAGLPVVRGRAAMSIERQVRIAAGALVAAGALGGAFVHPWCLALPVFVGGGLMFSGLTNTCGMGSVLARMPWNNRAHACAMQPSN